MLGHHKWPNVCTACFWNWSSSEISWCSYRVELGLLHQKLTLNTWQTLYRNRAAPHWPLTLHIACLLSLAESFDLLSLRLLQFLPYLRFFLEEFLLSRMKVLRIENVVCKCVNFEIGLLAKYKKFALFELLFLPLRDVRSQSMNKMATLATTSVLYCTWLLVMTVGVP